MEQLKIVVKKTIETEEEIEISLPAYRKELDWRFFKILSECSIIKIIVYGHGATIVRYDNDKPEVVSALKFKPCTEDEYLDGLKKAMIQINSVLETLEPEKQS